MEDHSLEHAAGLVRDGRFDAAIQALRQYLARSPAEPRAHLLLASAFGAKGDAAHALAHAGKAVELEPDNPQGHVLKAIYLFQAGQSEAALGEFDTALRLAPNSVEVCANLATALLKLGRAGAAITAFEKAVALCPDQPKLRAQLASAHEAAGDFAAAARHFSVAREQDPASLDYRIALANAHRLGGQLPRAIEVVKQAARDLGNSARLEEHLGTLHLALGDFAAAARHYYDALSLDPGEANALLGLCRLEDESSDPELRARVEARLSDGSLPEGDRISLLFGLGILLDGQGRHEDAMAAFAEGNRRKRATLAYDPGAEARSFAGMKAAFPPGLPAAVGGNPSDLPIFIVGMPRSGTTLVEQILAAHPAVRAGGELPYLRRMVLDWPDWPGAGRRYPEDVAALSADELHRLGQRYLDKVRHLSSGGFRITDKLPMNFMHLGLISRILPNARIVHCRRDAMDTCASNYTTLFGGLSAAFSYDLAELGGFHQLYEDLMAHWTALLGPAIHEIRYEHLVADQQAESRRLLECCGLDWTDRVLSHAAEPLPVLTASSVQVRKPLYRTAVGKWRRYGAALDPLKSALDPGS